MIDAIYSIGVCTLAGEAQDWEREQALEGLVVPGDPVYE